MAKRSTIERLVWRGVDNFTGPRMEDERVIGKIDIFCERFAETEDSLLETAFIMLETSSKFFPTVSEVFDAIEDLRRDQRFDKEKKQYNPKYWDRREAERLAKCISAARKTAEQGHEAVASVTRKSKSFQDVMEYARAYFPEISEETVLRNYNEISFAKSQSCVGCNVPRKPCPTSGGVIKMRMERNGYITTFVQLCGKHPDVIKGRRETA